MPMVQDGTRSIGEVLALLKPEFPDVTISKIRFLEGQGLVAPQRTPSGYRKFSGDDIDRLRYILRQQKEHFLPLKVIKGRLDQTRKLAAAETDARASGGEPDGIVIIGGTAMLSRSELVARSGLTDAQVRELEGYGLLEGRRSGVSSWYGEDALAIAKMAARYVQFGLDARHLRSLKTAADREAELYKQVVAPVRSQRNGQSKAEAEARLEELCRLGESMRKELLRQAIERD